VRCIPHWLLHAFIGSFGVLVKGVCICKPCDCGVFETEHLVW
jgi:hypothetical protein